MSVQLVQHKSRDFDVVLNFPETENTLSWAFTAENDGEIYAVDLDNVASYQIAGAPVALPYVVTTGTSYSVTIVKQTNGQPASISFNTRRAITKTLSINVPDFSADKGDYLFILFDNNTIEKHDASKYKKNLFNLATNTYDEESLISSISLPNPALYTDPLTQILSFNQVVFDPTTQSIIVIGFIGQVSSSRVVTIFVGKININTLALSALDGSANTYSEFSTVSYNGTYSEATKLGFNPRAFINYITSEIIVNPSNGYSSLNGYNPAKISIQDGTPIYPSSNRLPMLTQLYSVKCIDPLTLQYFGNSCKIDFDKYGIYNGLTLLGCSTYDNYYDSIFVAGSDNGAYHIFKRYGATNRGQIGIFQGSTNISICSAVKKSLVVAGGMIGVSNRNKFFLKDIDTDDYLGHYVISTFGSSFTTFPSVGMATDQCVSDVNDLTFVTFLSSGVYDQNNRYAKSNVLSVIDNSYASTLISSGETTGVAEAGYKVFPNKIVSICTNKIA